MNRLLLLCLSLLLFSLARPAAAACSASASTTDLGSISSFELASTAQTVTSGSGFSCTSGSLLSLLSTNTVTATLYSSLHASGTSPRLYNAASGSAIPYQICSDASCGSTYSIGSSISWSSTSLLGLLGLFNAQDSTLPLYLRSTTGINVPAGTYTDTLTINWSYRICFVGVLGVCSYTTGTATSTLSFSLVVTNDCYIDSAPDVSFASAALPAEFSSVSSSLSVRCTLNASYTVNLTSSNPVSGDWRQMAASSGSDVLQYQLWQSDGTAWTSGHDLSQTGSGTSQTINYTGSINAAQTAPPAGSYSDTVTVTVSY